MRKRRKLRYYRPPLLYITTLRCMPPLVVVHITNNKSKPRIVFPVLPAGDGPLIYGRGATLIPHDCCPRHFHPQYSMIDLLSVHGIHLSENLLETSLSHSQHALLRLTTQHSARPLRRSSDLHCCTDALRCTRTSLRAYTRCCTCAPRTNDG